MEPLTIESDGSINISIEDHEGQIRIQISDTGKGMSESEILKCQNPFYSTKGKFGTGLGLSIVSNIVKLHGDEFQIESDKGVGSTVTILLPAKEAAKPASLTSPTDKDGPYGSCWLIMKQCFWKSSQNC